MGKNLATRIAWRYLWAKKSHSAVSVIAAVSITGVAVATAAIVCVLSVFNGFRDVLTDKLDTLSPDVVVMPASGKVFANADSVADIVRKIDGVAVASPTLTDNALALYDTHEMPVTLKGVIPSEYCKLTSITQILKEGSEYFSPQTDEEAHSGAILSIGSAMQLGVHMLGTPMLLFAPRREGRINPANPAASFVQDSVAIIGVFQAQQSQFDNNMVIVPIDVAKELFQYDAEASAVEVAVNRGVNAEEVGERIAKQLGSTVVVKDRLRQQEVNFRMIEIEKWVTFLLLFFILLIASFNLISTLSMLVLEQQSSLQTLRSLGMTRKGIGDIYFYESLFVAAIGGLGGILLGVVLALLQQHFGLIRLNGDPEAMIISSYPVRLLWSDLVIAAIPVIVIGLITGFISSAFARSRVNR